MGLPPIPKAPLARAHSKTLAREADVRRPAGGRATLPRSRRSYAAPQVRVPVCAVRVKRGMQPAPPGQAEAYTTNPGGLRL